MTVLLTLIPSRFDTVANALRASPPQTWQEVVSRLRDFDTATRQEKKEVQGHVYVALQREVRELRALLTQTTQKGAGKGQKKTVKTTTTKKCWSCGKTGHVQKDCRSGGVQKKTKKGKGKSG